MSYIFNKPSIAERTGKKNRVNTDRFFHIMNEGWFVCMRKEKIDIATGIAGPFQTKPIASDYLNRVIYKNPSTIQEEPTEGSHNNVSEDWRY